MKPLIDRLTGQTITRDDVKKEIDLVKLGIERVKQNRRARLAYRGRLTKLFAMLRRAA